MMTWHIDLFRMPIRLNIIANPQKTKVKIIFAFIMNGSAQIIAPMTPAVALASIMFLMKNGPIFFCMDLLFGTKS